MKNKKRFKRLGFVSIEIVIAASVAIGAGLIAIPKFIDQAKDTTNKGQVIFDDLLSSVNQGGATGEVIPTPEPTPPPGEVKACKKEFNINNSQTWNSEGYTYAYTPNQTDAIFGGDGYKLAVKSTSTNSIPSVQPCTTVQSGETVLNVNSFYQMYQLNIATSIDVDFGKWDTSRVLDMSHMFNSAKATSIKHLDKLRTGNVRDMTSMLTATQATALDVSNFDTSNVRNMGYMFYSAQATTLDLSNFDTNKVTDARAMFAGYSATNPSRLTSLVIGSNFRVTPISNKSDMFNYKNASLVVRSTDSEALRQIKSAFPDVNTELIQ